MDIYFKSLCIFLCFLSSCNGARILGIFPTPSISHQRPFQSIMKALAARGHHVTTITTDPFKDHTPNYVEIDISFCYKQYRASFNFARMDKWSTYDIVNKGFPVMYKLIDDQLSSPQLQEFIRSSNNTKFDLVFMESIIYQAYYGLVHHVGSPPVIGITTFGYIWITPDSVGTPTNPSYITDTTLPFSSKMSFYERLQNTMFWLFIRLTKHYYIFPNQEAIMRKHFGEAPPSVYEADNNMDLLMIGSNWVFSYPAPAPPNIINYHSLHIKTKNGSMPKDLQEFLDAAHEGVIYFSLGTNVFSDHLSRETRDALISVFSELPMKVLWKWESNTMPGKPKNVKIKKWLPQQDVLAHPNIKLFISQCGLQSFQEAVFYAVPVLGIPFSFDQKYNVKKIQDSGMGLSLAIDDVTKESLSNAINELLYNSSYKKNMEKISALAKDEPRSSLENVIWWTEYVLRHKGAKHMRSAVLDLTWYQYLLLDVVAVIVLIIFILIFVLYYFLKMFYKHLLQINIKVKDA